MQNEEEVRRGEVAVENGVECEEEKMRSCNEAEIYVRIDIC